MNNLWVVLYICNSNIFYVFQVKSPILAHTVAADFAQTTTNSATKRSAPTAMPVPFSSRPLPRQPPPLCPTLSTDNWARGAKKTRGPCVTAAAACSCPQRPWFYAAAAHKPETMNLSRFPHCSHTSEIIVARTSSSLRNPPFSHSKLRRCFLWMSRCLGSQLYATLLVGIA